MDWVLSAAQENPLVALIAMLTLCSLPALSKIVESVLKYTLGFLLALLAMFKGFKEINIESISLKKDSMPKGEFEESQAAKEESPEEPQLKIIKRLQKKD